MRVAIVSFALFACSTQAPTGPGDEPGPDAAVVDPPPDVDACATPVALALVGRPLDLMPADRLAAIAARVPCIAQGAIRSIVESPRTLWYDKQSLTPGYQDSFGDNVVTPIGFRPNTIDPGLINLAVPGGHQQIFSELGIFHFPFGKPIGPGDNIEVVDFWRLPDEPGSDAYRPVVHWQRDPNSYTHRIEWMFPVGTVFGEMIFLDEGGELHPSEIRTRTRTATGWEVDALRPFPTAEDFAAAIEARRGERPEWAESPALDALITQLRGGSLSPFHVVATHFPGSFPVRNAGIEQLPELTGSDAELTHELLRTTAFRSAKGVYWKQDGALSAWAASSSGKGQIVPKGYNAAAVEISQDSCDSCHRDAGRPFETWYDNILAYGELWGNDETFTWHPFTLSKFVDAQGKVVNFNHDNREIRPDFKAAGLIEPYKPADHPASVYQRIVREWTDFRY
ncbi:MAG: hypothetical protein H0V17_19895 [Deltaproteobacteria bacterium]|nr:hypothetical protein [Deltaproteobacteria bacterium]